MSRLPMLENISGSRNRFEDCSRFIWAREVRYFEAALNKYAKPRAG